jgi:long-chain acyl-CoA synthetase
MPIRPHLATLLDDFRTFGHQKAIVQHTGNRRKITTYEEIATLASRFAALLATHNLQPGDRLILWAQNSAEWVAAFHACILRGVIAVPLDAYGTPDFAARVAADVKPALITGDAALLQTLPDDFPKLAFEDWPTTLPAQEAGPIPTLSHDTPLQILFTSGTTGDPKGIVHTHGNVLASLDPLEKEIGKYLRYERLVHPLRILHTLPLSHVFGQFMGLWVPPLLVAEVHFEDRLQAPRLVRMMHEERISVLAAVPRVLDLMRAWVLAEFPGLDIAAARGQSVWKRWWRFRALHRRLGLKFWAFVCGGASLPADLESFWTTAGFALVQGYGMTETTALVTLNHPFKTARGSIGKPLAGREVKIGDDGEILVRGDSIASRVWQRGGMQTVEPGWLATGDLAARDERGELVFAGRKSDVIVTAAGLNIHPQDLEAVLRRQPGIREALVVGYASPAGPAPAAVLIADAADGTLQRAVDDANQDLAAFQQIRYWLRWPQPEFPRTTTGKVLRRTVQSWAQPLLAGSSAAGDGPSDPLLELLRPLGVENRELAAGDRLAEDLHLDSLAMVQLQSSLETRFGLELSDGTWGQIKTVGDVRALFQPVESPAPATSPAAAPPPSAAFPRWPWWPWVRALRIAFIELLARPLVWLLAGPRIAPRHILARPSLLVANHLTAVDVPVILYALSSSDRQHVAVAMSGRLLTGWRRGQAERHRVVAVLTPVAYWLVTALFNVFPLPRGAGLRQSFAHAGEAMNHGYHVLVFPEGRRSRDGQLQPFEPGIGLLAQECQVPVQPIFIEGLGLRGGKQWPKRGAVAIRLGAPLTMEPGEEPLAFAERLQAAVAALR